MNGDDFGGLGRYIVAWAGIVDCKGADVSWIVDQRVASMVQDSGGLPCRGLI